LIICLNEDDWTQRKEKEVSFEEFMEKTKWWINTI
jgi:hypothetical protein